ncbi:uncharacterized protein LOC143891908 [Tasmannia lanceolata]|uniref:uncharacterized protein LOC143891908 n=1 Tax=Tasmannia lanceolata TaxID=3420 RepID=UPI00406376A4
MFSLETDTDVIFSLELKAILKGILLAEKLNISDVWIESDSLFAVNIIAKKSTPPWKDINLINKISETLVKFNQWSISHCWREGNAVADCLSKRNYTFKGLDLPPWTVTQDLMELLHRDRNGEKFVRL